MDTWVIGISMVSSPSLAGSTVPAFLSCYPPSDLWIEAIFSHDEHIVIYRKVNRQMGNQLCISPSTKRINSEYQSPFVVQSRFSIFSIPHLICVSRGSPIWGESLGCPPQHSHVSNRMCFFRAIQSHLHLDAAMYSEKGAISPLFFLDFFQAVGTHRVGCQILAWHARFEKVNLQGKLKLMRFKQMCDFSGTPFQLFVALCVGGFKQKKSLRQVHANNRQALFTREDWYTNFRSSTWFMSIVLE